MHEPGLQGKSYDIPKRLVWEAWLRVEENGGAAGPDGVTIGQFQGKVQDNLYKLWNRMCVPRMRRVGGRRACLLVAVLCRR
jgi:RNA-directed DNA polymerase